MSDISGVKVSVIGIELDQQIDEDRVILDFFTGQKLVDSFFLKDGRLSHEFEYTDDFEFVRLVVRAVDNRTPLGQILLTFSFLNECDVQSGNEQWLPLSDSENEFLVAKDFNEYNASPP